MFLANGWKDYQLLDCGQGEKLERWGEYTLRRPDPQVIWPPVGGDWQRPDAHYRRDGEGGGSWALFRALPESWTVRYGGLTFKVRPTGFKHTGLFPEQAVNWDWMGKLIGNARGPVQVLNLFAYTGGATLACLKAGAEVCHVDAAKGMVQWARENAALSGLSGAPVRYIVDDCLKFVQREARRGKTYRGVVMDPPSYGRGPGKEVWKLEDALFNLVSECLPVLPKDALFFLINSYTTGLQASVLSNILELTVKKKLGGSIIADEVGLPVSTGNIALPCGASGRWQAE